MTERISDERLCERAGTMMAEFVNGTADSIDPGDVVELLQDLVGRITELRSQVRWRPMEEAPKDGTPILCFWRNLYGGDDSWAVAQWREPVDRWGEPGWYEEGNGENQYGEPDYWMPLPPKPAQPQRTFHSKSEAKRVTALMEAAQPGSGEVKREPRTHALKVWSDFFPALADGSKTFEVRFDDRGFRVGDRLYLNEWIPHKGGGGEYTGGQLCKVITYILAGPMFGIARDHVVMGLADPEPDDFCKFLALDDLQTELTAAQQRIADLTAGHVARDKAMRECADRLEDQDRRIRELEARNAERNRQNAAAFQDRDELERDARRYRYLRNQEGLPSPEEFDRMIDADMALLEGGADPFSKGEKTDDDAGSDAPAGEGTEAGADAGKEVPGGS